MTADELRNEAKELDRRAQKSFDRNEKRKCHIMVSKRDSYRLPPNIDKYPCSKPAHSPSGTPTCVYHKRVELKSLLRSLEKRIGRSHSQIERINLGGHLATLREQFNSLA